MKKKREIEMNLWKLSTVHCLAIAKKYRFETIAASQFHSYSKGFVRLVCFFLNFMYIFNSVKIKNIYTK